MIARDFRARAREALQGKWGVAVGLFLVATLLSGSMGDGNSGSMVQLVAQMGKEGLVRIPNRVLQEYWVTAQTLATVALLLQLFLGGVIAMGMARFGLNLLDRREASFSDLFSNFHRLGAGIAMTVLRGVFVYLWSLLLVIPGIVAQYRYALMPYLMAEYPDLGAMDAMRESKRLMMGNKWRLFCLQMSFLGWVLLSALTMGVGMLWVTPYIEVSRAAFYREITETWQPDDRRRYANPEF